MIRRDGNLIETSWPEALDAAATVLARVRNDHGPGAIGVLGGARGTNEDAYAWARLAKGVIGTDNVDAQLADGLPPDVVLGMPRATIGELERARAIVVLAGDLKQELPVLYLRVRRAAAELNVPLIDVSPRDNGLTACASTVLRHVPGAPSQVMGEVVSAIEAVQGDGPVVVVLGRTSVAESPDAVVHAASRLASLPNARFLSALRRGNVHGALDLGMTPGFLPGRVTLDAGRDHVSEQWGSTPETVGLDAAAMLQGAIDGTLKVLVLVGCDLLTDFPDRRLARDALGKVERVISIGAFADDSAGQSDVFLPSTVWGEQAGTTSNLEGRVLRLGRKVSPEGHAMEGWRIAGELATRLGTEFDLETIDEVQDEIARVAPAFAGVDAALIRRARDGVVLPLADRIDEVTFTPAPTSAGVSWEPLRPHAEQEESENGDGAIAPSGPPVTLHTWSGDAPEPPPAPADAYSLRLVAGRTLYGTDRITSMSPSLARLAEADALLIVNARDRDRLGVADGDRVRVSSPRNTIEMPVHADPATPVGVAFIATNRTGAGAGELLDVTEHVTDLRVETL
jgi:NADH-quinone oxidoreductase subunit G